MAGTARLEPARFALTGGGFGTPGLRVEHGFFVEDAQHLDAPPMFPSGGVQRSLSETDGVAMLITTTHQMRGVSA